MRHVLARLPICHGHAASLPPIRTLGLRPSSQRLPAGIGSVRWCSSSAATLVARHADCRRPSHHLRHQLRYRQSSPSLSTVSSQDLQSRCTCGSRRRPPSYCGAARGCLPAGEVPQRDGLGRLTSAWNSCYGRVINERCAGPKGYVCVCARAPAHTAERRWTTSRRPCRGRRW